MRCNLHDYDIMEEARTEAKLEAAQNMLKENDSVEKVARCLALPLETIEQLAAKLQPAAKKISGTVVAKLR